MKYFQMLLFTLLVVVSTAQASEWQVASESGGIFTNENPHKLIIRFDGNSVELINPSRVVSSNGTSTTKSIDNIQVTPISISVPKSQMLGLLTQLENLIMAGDDTAKAMRSIADLYGKDAEVIAEIDAIRQIVSNAN
jgi:hypothetical protein